MMTRPGSQAVHGVQVVTVLDEDAYAAALAGSAAACFALTNTRSLDERAAASLTARAARGLIAAARRRRRPDSAHQPQRLRAARPRDGEVAALQSASARECPRPQL